MIRFQRRSLNYIRALYIGADSQRSLCFTDRYITFVGQCAVQDDLQKQAQINC